MGAFRHSTRNAGGSGPQRTQPGPKPAAGRDVPRSGDSVKMRQLRLDDDSAFVRALREIVLGMRQVHRDLLFFIQEDRLSVGGHFL